MIRFALVLAVGAFFALFLFPWPVAAVLGALAAPFLPVIPVALGLIADTLYLASGATPHTLPVATLIGFCGSVIGFLVRRHLEARIMAP